MPNIPAGFRPFTVAAEDFLRINGPLYVKPEDKYLLMGFRVEERHCNPANTCHGGMLMTFCDMQLAIGANYAGDLQRFLPTISLSADFLAPAPLGTWVQGRAEVARQARSMVFAHCIVTADGIPVVRANGIFQIRGEPSPDFAIRAKLNG